MDGKKVLEWGVIAIVVLFVWRWINAALAGGGGSIQSSNYYAPVYPAQPYGVVSMYASPVGWGPYSGGSWNDPGNYGGWYSGGDYPVARGGPVGTPGGSKRW
jgi:hypothetical protein